MSNESQPSRALDDDRDTLDAETRREDDRGVMQLREEALRAQKQAVEAGRVQVNTDVVTEERTLDVPVTREEVTIERRPVDRQPSDTPIDDRGEHISVPIHEEQVTLEKRPVVYDEVEVGKRAVQETREVSGTVCREEARVE